MTDVISKKTDTYKLKCLIVDDETIAIKVIEDNINKLDFLSITATCSSAVEAAEVLVGTDIDLMFLDINMPDLSGLEFLESLDQAPMTIFTTAYSEYAVDAFRLQVVDYLLKPIDFKRFFQATQKAKEMYHTHLMLKSNAENTKTEVYIRQGDCFQRIDWRDILFVEGLQNYLKLHFQKTTLIIHQTMTSLEEMLPKEYFFRVHRSFLINLSYIQKIRGNMVYIDGTIIHIAKPRKEDLLKSVVYKSLISK